MVDNNDYYRPNRLKMADFEINLKKSQDACNAPLIWQYILEHGKDSGAFSRIYHGPELVEKKFHSSMEMAAAYVVIQSKQHEENYRKEVEQWRINRKIK